MSEDRNELDLGRAEQAARDHFAGRAATADFEPLDPATLREPALARRRRRWTGAGLAAAACLVAGLAVVPLVLRPGLPSGPIPATPEPGAGFAWTQTAPSPLSPRFGSLTAWIADGFYVIGGWTGGPCPPGALCDMAPPDAPDGARYDPGTDTWAPIADPPVGLGRDYANAAVVGSTLYVATFVGDGSLLAYDAQHDRWEQKDAPPVLGRLVGLDGRLAMVMGGEATSGYTYDAGADSWTPWEGGPLDACTDLQGFAAGDRVLVLAECAEYPDTDRQVSTYDPAAGTWTEPLPLDAAVEGGAVHVDARLVWPDALTADSPVESPGIFDTTGGTWLEVDATAPAGPLAFRGLAGSTPHVVLDDLGLVAANGRLLEAVTAGWVEVPDLPGPERWDPVAVASPSSVLECFGYEYADDTFTSGSPVDGCHLLARPDGSDPTVPPASPDPTTPTQPGLAWQPVLEGVDPVPTDPLLVAAGGRFYLMGGYHLTETLDDVQLTDVRRYDPATGGWEALADLPEAAVSRPYTLAADVVGDLIYVHLSFEELGELWVYDTVADSWSRVGRTDETEHYLGTEDGLVRFRLLGDGRSDPAPQILQDGNWTDLPAPGESPLPAARVVRLDDHHLGLVSDGRMSVLDTAARSWGEPSEPGQVGDWSVTGVDGAAVFVDPAAGEREPTDSRGPEVAILRDGEWSYVMFPLAYEAPPAGLAPVSGVAAGKQLVVDGRLLDTRTGQWSGVPALPGSEPSWQARYLAGGEPGILTCYPAATSAGESEVIPSCYFLATP